MLSIKHISKVTFKQIFIDHWESFKQNCHLYDTVYYDSVINKMINCGDPEKMGYAKYRCIYCGSSYTISMTCKSCFCLSCSVPYADRWIDFIGRRLIPGVVYRHVVLTVPDFLGCISTVTAIF
ncbi:MAG TPA: hypothetical protein DDX37_12155 [Candidatus Omnitrophica bacterium]|nr:hypothetical protein [Candidatus Omnitrophota bacterium]